MAVNTDFAIHEILRPVRTSGEDAIVLTRRLLNSAPDDLSKTEKKALKLARDGAVDLQQIMQLRARRRPENMLAEDRALDGCWGAVHDQIEAWTRIPNHPNGQEAQFLLTSLFPGGLDFTNTKYEVQWVESTNRLERIAEEGHEARLEKLIHPRLMPLLRRAHEAFGEKLGVGTTFVEVPETSALIEAIRTQAFLIANYARVLSASVDIMDERTIARFQKATAPIVAHRAASATTRTTTTPEPDPDTDVIDPEAPIPEPPLVDAPVTDEPPLVE